MNNEQLIKSAHVWFLAVLLACGLAVAASKGIGNQGQNSNQNSNQNGNANGNTNANTNTSQNRNANRGANRNDNTATGGQAGMSSQDRNFLMDAAMSSMLEIELGRIAAQRGTSEAVKQFGQRMVDDHTKANTELMSLASSKGITLPAALDEKHQQRVTKMSGMSGRDFDRAYARMMVDEHDDAVEDFEKQSNRGSDPDLKAFATKTLPALQEHLQMAKALDGTQRGNSNRGGSTNRNRNGNNNGNSNRNNNDNSNRP